MVPLSENVSEGYVTNNYHPASSLLSVASKIFEKLVSKRLVNHFEKSGLQICVNSPGSLFLMVGKLNLFHLIVQSPLLLLM